MTKDEQLNALAAYIWDVAYYCDALVRRKKFATHREAFNYAVKSFVMSASLEALVARTIFGDADADTMKPSTHEAVSIDRLLERAYETYAKDNRDGLSSPVRYLLNASSSTTNEPNQEESK